MSETFPNIKMVNAWDKEHPLNTGEYLFDTETNTMYVGYDRLRESDYVKIIRDVFEHWAQFMGVSASALFRKIEPFNRTAEVHLNVKQQNISVGVMFTHAPSLKLSAGVGISVEYIKYNCSSTAVFTALRKLPLSAECGGLNVTPTAAANFEA